MRSFIVVARRAMLFSMVIMGLVAAAHAADEAEELPPREGETKEIEIFNGKDLTGWKGHDHYWSVKDGMIVGRSTDKVPVSTYLFTERDDYEDFRLILDTRLVESEVHSGVAFWGRQAPEHGDEYTFAGHLVMFPLPWGMYDLFGRTLLPVDPTPAKKVGHQHEWNNVEILAQANRVQIAINGHKVADWRDPKKDAKFDGPIGLQLHSNTVPQENHFKNLKLTVYPKGDKLITVKESDAKE